MGDDPAEIKPPKKGYYRLGAPVRAAIANLCAATVLVAAVVALFDTPRLDGVWLRLPALCALIVADGAAWFVFARLRDKASPILRGGLFVALVGVSLVAAAMNNASSMASLAGGLGLAAAFALRGSLDRAQVKGRDMRPGLQRKPMNALFDQIESLASALVIVLLVWHFALEAFRIPSGSMAPTLSGDPVWGDRVFVDKMAYEFRDPVRWEPTVFRYPLRRSDPYVKRLIGYPGEELLIAQGDIYVRRNEGSGIELLAKDVMAREVLWLPLLRELSGNKDWVANFKREGEVEFKDGAIRIGKRGSAVFPKGSTDAPGNVMDHDASFGDTETPKENFGRNVCGDLRARLRVELEEEGGLDLVLVRDADRFSLRLRPGAGKTTLAHTAEDGTETPLGKDELGALDLQAGSAVDVAMSFADGVLRVVVDDAVFAKATGTPLLAALQSRDKLKRLDLSSLDAVKLGATQPAGGRKARIELAGGDVAGAVVKVLGFERDVYYIGRVLPELNAGPERPLGLKLGDDQYFVLGDNSPGSKDARAWIRAILRLKDGTQVVGGLDDAGQELALLLAGAGRESGLSALQKLQRVAMLHPTERDDGASDFDLVQQAMEALRTHARQEGRGAVDFYTEGGGIARVTLSEIETIQVQMVPYVERKLFVGRPFAVFLSPRGAKLIN